MRRLLSILPCLAALATASQAAPVYPSSEETAKLISANRFDELDRRFGAIQADYRDGRISDVELRLAFRAFRLDSDDLAPHFRAWVEHAPKSYIAHLTRGMYYRFVGARLRGYAFASESSPAQLSSMGAANAVAAQEFGASLELEKRPLLAYADSILVAMETGDKDGARAMLKRGLAVDRGSFVIREQYMIALQSRWLGDLQQMRAFLTECQVAGLSSAQLRTLESLVVEDEAWVKQFREHDHMTAIAKYRESANLDSKRSYCKYCGPLLEGAQLAYQHGLYDKAIEFYTRALAQDPDISSALDNRGYSYLISGKDALAAEDFSRSAKLGSAYAQTILAKMMINGGPIPENRPEALRLLELAAAQNYAEAKRVLDIERKRTQKPAAKARPKQ